MVIPSSPEEMLRLIHELAVHQLELEMQQEELKLSREELEKSLDRYTDLYDFAPVGYLTLALDSTIIDINLTSATILGVARSRLRGKLLNNFIVHKDRQTFTALLERVFRCQEPNYCEVVLSEHGTEDVCQKILHIEAVINDDATEFRTIITDISQQKKIELAMRVTNERQQLIIDVTHSGSWEWNVQTNQTVWSNEMWLLLGLAPFSCESTYSAWIQSILDEDRYRVEQCVLEAIKHEQEFTVEWRVKNISGQQRWLMSKGTPYHEDDGQVNRYVGIIIDITELKKAQEIGEKEQAFNKTIIDSIPGTFYIVGKEGCYTGWNTFQRDAIVGKEESEMRQVMAISTIHPEDREFIQQKMVNVLESGLDEHAEARILLRGGPEFRWFLMTGRRIIIEGNPFLIGIGIDITEQKKIEADYRELFDSVPVGLYQSTMDGKIIAANQHCLNIARCKKFEQEVWFQQDTRQSYVHPEDGRRFRDLLLQKGHIDNFEADFLLMDGTVATLSNTAKIVFNGKGEPDFIAGSFIDVTEHKQNEKERAELIEQLQQAQKMEMIGRLAGGIAHDFNNMLTVILGHSEIALELFDPSDTVYKDLEAIRNAASRSSDLTRQLLAFARKQIVTPKILELNSVVEGLLPMLRRIIGEHITLTWLPDRKSSQINIDPSQIDQILVNLCINARDSITGNGHITLECNSHTRADITSNTSNTSNSRLHPVDHLTLSVHDDGCGIEQNYLDHIFEPFFTTKEQGKGTGLGLSMVYGIVKQNNGNIECESQPGKGTIFTIHLPLYSGQSKTVEEAQPEQLTHKGQTILLVEDEFTVLQLSKIILERNGYTVLTAEAPEKALRMAKNFTGTIDLLLTDVIMPEMNGSELSQKLQSSYPNLKTLFMSGFTADIIARNSVLDSGINFIQKPFNFKSLTTAVYTILNSEKVIPAINPTP